MFCKKTEKRIQLIGLLTLFFSSLLCSQLSAQDQTVRVKGFGLNVQEAEDNALHNAIRQVLGSMIAAKTAVANDELIEDRILVVSGGFVKTHKVIGTPILNNGIVEIEVEAVVAKNSLSDALSELQLGSTTNEANSLFTEDAAEQFKTKLEDRRTNTELSTLLFRKRLDLVRLYSGEATSYSEVGEYFDTHIRVGTDVSDWQNFRRGCEAVLQRCSLAVTTQATPTVPLSQTYAAQQFVELVGDATPDTQKELLQSAIPVACSGIPVGPLLKNAIQTKAAHTWVLWVQIQSSYKSTLWKGYLMNTDPSVLFPFLTSGHYLETKITATTENVIVEDRPLFQPQLIKKAWPAERCEFGIFALSSEGVALHSNYGASHKVESINDVGDFWEANQDVLSPKLNIFLTMNPTVFTPPEFVGDVVYFNDQLDSQDKEKILATVLDKGLLRLIHTAKPNSQTKLVPGFRVKRRLPLKPAEFASAKSIGTSLAFDYALLFKRSQLEHELSCNVELELGPTGTAQLLTLESPAFNKNSLLSILSQNRELKVLKVANGTGIDQSLEDWHFSHGITHLDLVGGDVTSLGLGKLKSLPFLEVLGLQKNKMNADSLEQLKTLKTLKTLDLSECDFSETNADSLEKLKLLTKLETLDLSACNLLEIHKASISKLEFVEKLVLDGNTDINNDWVNALTELRDLKTLSIRNTSIDEKGIEALRKRMPECTVVSD